MTPGWLAGAVDQVSNTVDAPDLPDYLRGITGVARGLQHACIAVADLEGLAAELAGPPWPAPALAPTSVGADVVAARRRPPSPALVLNAAGRGNEPPSTPLAPRRPTSTNPDR